MKPFILFAGKSRVGRKNLKPPALHHEEQGAFLLGKNYESRRNYEKMEIAYGFKSCSHYI